jgi:carbonic anhydrase
VKLSAAQIEEFRTIFRINARLIQPLNGRPVLTEGE